MECAYAHTWILIMEEWRLRQWNNFQSRPCFGGGCSTCRSKQGQTPAQTHACICLQLSFSSNSSFLCESALDYEYLIPGYSSTMVLGAGYIVHNITGMYCVIMITNVLLPLLFGYSSTRVPLCIVLCLSVGKRTTSESATVGKSERERARDRETEREREGVGGDDSERPLACTAGHMVTPWWHGVPSHSPANTGMPSPVMPGHASARYCGSQPVRQCEPDGRP